MDAKNSNLWFSGADRTIKQMAAGGSSIRSALGWGLDRLLPSQPPGGWGLPNPQSWLSEHPLIAWMVQHPLWAIGVILLSALLLSGLVRAIARFSEQAWLSILQAPFRLGQWIWGAAFKPSQQRTIGSASSTNQERISQVLSQLEALRLQQEALLQELKALLAARDRQSEQSQRQGQSQE